MEKYKLFKNEKPDAYGYYWIRTERINGITKEKEMTEWYLVYFGEYNYKRKIRIMINWINNGQQEFNSLEASLNASGLKYEMQGPVVPFNYPF